MNAAAPLSSPPISTDGNDWSPINAYPAYGNTGNLSNPNLKGFPDTPPVSSGHTSTSTTDGAMQNGARGGNPSPPSSISRGSVDSRSIAGSIDSRRAYMMEESLSEHYKVLKAFLAPYLNEANGQQQNRARDKLLRLTSVQFQELSTDVYDELLRREDEKRSGGPGVSNTPKYLLPKQNFHPKRNQARQKLSTLPPDRFRQLATDVYFELERRYPRFAGGRPGSNAGSIMMGPPRVGTPNSFRPPPRTASRGLPEMQRPGTRNGSVDNNAPSLQRGLEINQNDYGQPMPKTFQSNTIVPNKGLMVEDDDDDDNSRDMNGAGADSAELRSQVDQLERKVDELQAQLREKDDALERAQSAASRNPSIENERSEWSDLKTGLEMKLKEAKDLNENLQAELNRLRNDKTDSERMLREDLEVARRNERDVERELRGQLDEARREGREMERDLRAQLASASASVTASQTRGRSASTSNGSSERYEALERELAEQKQTTEEVRRDAAQFLQEMRELSSQSVDALEKEERLLDQVSALEREIREWKARYAKLKSQNRSLRASMLGLPGANGDATAVARDSMFSAPDGLIKDVHVTSYQIAIDELLQLARRPESADLLIECMKQVVLAVRNISSDIESLGTPESSLDAGSVDSMKQQSLLRAKLSQAANNLITATKAHAAAAGLAPVSLVDAAASNLTTVVMDLVRAVKVKPSPADELDSPDSPRDKALPVPPSRGVTPTFNGLQARPNGVNGHVRNQSSVGSGYSAYSRYSRYSNNMSPARESSNGIGIVPSGQGMGALRESSLEDFKNFLDDSTALLVRSIQPLVSTVRSGSADDQTINEYIRDISMTVEDITEKTNAAILETASPALKRHAPPVIKVLEKSRIELNQERNSKDKLPPVAFRIARATKVCNSWYRLLFISDIG